MPETEQQQPVFRFGVFEINPHLRELRKHGVKLKLQDQPLQILLLLLEGPGEVVAREEIQKRLWPENTYVDFDNAINSAVRKLRDALDDSPENPRFVETLARRGYRFIGPVSRPAAVIHPSSTIPVPPRAISTPATKKRHPWRVVSAATAALALAGFGISWRMAKLKDNRSESPSPPAPLTSYPGYERFPTFSPDGTRVAFTWDEPRKRTANIYMKLIGAGDPVRLTTDSEGDFAPAWSPDGRWIAFLRARDTTQASVMLMPAVGGQERELTRVDFAVAPILRHWPAQTAPLVTWSLDAKWLVAVERMRPKWANHIIRISVETGDKRVLTSGSGGLPLAGDGNLALSPDGKLLAFTRSSGISVADLYVVPLSRDMLAVGKPEQVTHDGKKITGVAWAPDGRNLVLSSTRGGKLELWQVAPQGGSKPVKLAASGDDPQDLAISRQGYRLAYAREFGDVNIWRVGLTGGDAEKTDNVISSTRSEVQPSYSPDGRQIAFESDRSGDENIWIANADGANPRQVTFYKNAWAGSPRWSPDGQKIAYDCNVAGNWDIYVISSQGGRPVQLTSTPVSEYRPSWSHDGNWIYFSSMNQIRKIPAGGGKDLQVAQNAGGTALESPDGKTLYFVRRGQLCMKPVVGGEEKSISDSVYFASFSPAQKGVYMIDRRDLHLKLLDSRGNLLKTIASVPEPASIGMSISPDERWMIYPKTDNGGSELMLVENFH